MYDLNMVDDILLTHIARECRSRLRSLVLFVLMVLSSALVLSMVLSVLSGEMGVCPQHAKRGNLCICCKRSLWATATIRFQLTNMGIYSSR
jgi:hypothetical protein